MVECFLQHGHLSYFNCQLKMNGGNYRNELQFLQMDWWTQEQAPFLYEPPTYKERGV